MQELKKLYKKQISLTEWLKEIDHEKADAFRTEDNNKRDRLAVLRKIIGIPFDKPYKWPVVDIAERSLAFTDFLLQRGNELCALRLVPLETGLPKLRMRGMSIREVVDTWFEEQDIDPTKYVAEVVPHSEQYEWSTIFVINEHGVFGEIVAGGHHILTQGFYDEVSPISFSYNFSEWKFSRDDTGAAAHMKKLISLLHVTDADKKNRMNYELNSEFLHDYLCGYFETVQTTDFGLWFIDYNRVLGDMYTTYSPKTKNNIDALLHGQVGHAGVVKGKVRIVDADKLANTQFDDGDILVCDMTTPAYVPLMKRAGAIVTDRGGILTHAAIISRELRIPCIVGTKDATKKLKDGDMVVVDANAGVVRFLSSENSLISRQTTL